MPGLVNCHGHSPMTLVRSAGDGLPLDRWLSESVWPREALHDDDDVFWGMTLGAHELLVQRGDDHLRAVPAPRGGRRGRPGLGHPLRAHARGVRRHRHRPGRHLAGPPGRGLPHLRRDGRARGAAARRLRPPRRLQPAPGRVCRPWPQEAQRRGAMVQIHLSETEAEGRVVEERYGMSAPALLASLGVFDGPVLAAHAVWLDDADMALLAEHDVAVAHCPGSNGKLGSGVARLAEMLARGIRVGLGTDGPASNDDLHLWDEMRLAAILARATAADPGVLTSATALRLATRGGGEALGPPGRCPRGGPPGRHHPAAHRRRPLRACAQRRRAARAPGLGRCRLPGDRRLGGRRGRGDRRPHRADRRGAGPRTRWGSGPTAFLPPKGARSEEIGPRGTAGRSCRRSCLEVTDCPCFSEWCRSSWHCPSA